MKKRNTMIAGILGALICPLMLLPPKPADVDYETGYEATSLDSTLFYEKQRLAVADVSTGYRSLAVAESFLGTPYVLGVLDRSQTEKLTVNLRELDCWTFVENSVAIAMTADGKFDSYVRTLEELRYWGGNISGYGSRIHYFTGWLLQAEKRGLLQDMTHAMGGIRYEKRIGYISARPHKYPKINNEKVLKDIRMAENRLNAHEWYFIPQAQIAKMEHLIQEGDIICITSAKKDLDIAHQGFAVKLNGRIHLMHASSLSKRVILSRQPLSSYVISQPGQTGIMVARLK
ncbi:MAG: DUF1460 domain-containing protein [Saprospiraceae bacterium]|nr:DUF1460 domain-containing protein [Saprospiraceae bacterium]